MAIKQTEEEFIDELLNPISDIIQETQYKVLSIITSRINSIGKLSATDVHQLGQLIKQQDLAEIESIIAKGTDRSVKEVDSIIVQAAQNNDDLAKYMYEYRNMPPSSFKTDLSLLNAVQVASESIRNDIVKLSDTSAMNLIVNGKPVDIEKAYNYAVNRAVFEVQQGYFDYNTSVRGLITEMAKNGLGVIEYESGYRRRLDSAARMNVSDGIRSLNTSYRKIQGESFGADGIEISAHALCAPDHLPDQGKQFSNEEFEQLQSSLSRPFFKMNCHHSSFPIILGISDPVYSDKELQAYKKSSEKEVEYTTLQKDKDGNYIKKKTTRYQASQTAQRNIETNIRQLKDIRNQLSINNDSIGVAEYNKRIKSKTAYYKKVSEQIGLDPKMDRLRVYSPSSTAKPKEILKRTPKIIPEPPKNITQEPSKLRKALEDSDVQYMEVERLPRNLSSDEIIERLGGGDMTGGSCSSLGFAYIGNKAGLDVLDFRGGTSREFFSRNSNIQEMVGLEGVKGKVVKVQKEIAGTMELMKDLEPGKEYYLAVGRHAAIIRRTETGAEYLELQSKLKNGWTSFHNADYGSTSDTLFKRFGCRKTVDKMKIGSTSMISEKPVVLIDVDSLQGNEEFRKILGYVNTSVSMQKKGALGNVK